MTSFASAYEPAVDERDLAARLSALTLEQKVELLVGAGFAALRAQPAIGLRAIAMSDGPAGMRGMGWDERDPSQSLPCPAAMGATWDPALIESLAAVSALDGLDKGMNVCLGPGVNLQRSPYGGRSFEYYSEDPFLSGRMGTAFTIGLQSHGVAACPKHFVANDSDTERMTVDVRVDERVLREVYLAPFAAIVAEATPWSLMSSYNRVNGSFMSEHPMLRSVLKREWGFDGALISDFYSVGTLVEAASEGLDIAMPAPRVPWGDALVAAVRAGEVPAEAIDDKVLRILRLASRVGALDAGERPATGTRDFKAEEALLRRAAASSFVLLSNPASVLPLSRSELTSVAVLGNAAAFPRINGGGSSRVIPPYSVSPLDGIQAALAGIADVRYAEGVRPHGRPAVATAPWLRTDDGRSGVIVEMIGRDGTVLLSEHRDTGDFMWMGSLAPGLDPALVATLRVTTEIHAVHGGVHQVGFSGVGDYRLTLGGAARFDAAIVRPAGMDIVEAMSAPPVTVFDVDLDPGKPLPLVLEHAFGSFDPPMPFAVFQLRIDTPFAGTEEEIAKAVKLAADSDVAVVVVGTTSEVETEGLDRKDLELPGNQNELVRRVAAVNPRTIVVVNAGAPVLLPWADEVAAALVSWFPGQEFGHALADVLLGDAEPGGRLPMTWPAAEADVLTTIPVDGVLSYVEGVHVGHRRYDRDGIDPRFPFGHGLGFSTWEVRQAQGRPAGDTGITITATLANTGERPSSTVLQAYLSKPQSNVERPVRWLAGFATAACPPGEQATVEIAIPRRSFEHWDQAWVTEDGPFTVELGLSSRDLRSRIQVTP
jgi:beta-glucosidase